MLFLSKSLFLTESWKAKFRTDSGNKIGSVRGRDVDVDVDVVDVLVGADVVVVQIAGHSHSERLLAWCGRYTYRCS